MTWKVIVLTFLLGTLLSTADVANAVQTSTDVDIAAVSEVVLDADPEAVAEGLATPLDDAELPEGFFNPPSGTPEHEDLIAQFTGAIGEIDGAIATLSHAFDTDPAIVPGEISTGIVTYIVSGEEITFDDLDQFEEGAREGFETATPGAEGAKQTSDPQGTVERIELGGVDAVAITVAVAQSDVSMAVRIVAVPVGTTLVIGTALVADEGLVDPVDVLPFAEELTLAGVAHLETVAEGAQ